MTQLRVTEEEKRATEILYEYIIKGFAMDDEMFEHICEIRLSERRFYQKITDIYVLSADYDAKDRITKDFFAQIQNKLH